MRNRPILRYAAAIPHSRPVGFTIRSTAIVRFPPPLRLLLAMHSSRSPKSTYTAAFLLGALVALLLVLPGRAAELAPIDLRANPSFTAQPALHLE